MLSEINMPVAEFRGRKGQGYCQGGFSADFTRVRNVGFGKECCILEIRLRFSPRYCCYVTGREGGAWWTWKLLLARLEFKDIFIILL